MRHIASENRCWHTDIVREPDKEGRAENKDKEIETKWRRQRDRELEEARQSVFQNLLQHKHRKQYLL